jgi:hypothetical protein
MGSISVQRPFQFCSNILLRNVEEHMNRRAFLCQLLCAAGAVAATAASAPLAHALTPADLKLPPDSALPAPEPAISHGDEATAEEAQWFLSSPLPALALLVSGCSREASENKVHDSPTNLVRET